MMIQIIDSNGTSIKAGALKFSGALSHRGNNVYSVSDMNLSRRESTATTTKDVTNWNVHERVSRPEDHQVSHIYDKTNVKRSGTVEKLTATVTHDKLSGTQEKPGRTVTELIRSGTVDHRPTVTHLQQRGTVTLDLAVTHLSHEAEVDRILTTTRQYDVTEPRATHERVIETSIANTVTQVVTAWDIKQHERQIEKYVTKWIEQQETDTNLIDSELFSTAAKWCQGSVDCQGAVILIATNFGIDDYFGVFRRFRFSSTGELQCLHDFFEVEAPEAHTCPR